MNLKPRFLLLTALLVLVSAVAAWFASRQVAEAIVEQWAVRYAEKQVLYDKARTLQPLLREIALSRQLANAPALKVWARAPGDPVLMREAIQELERYRLNFAERNYFLALRKNGGYYHNNAANEFAGQQHRYALNSKKPEDRWFFDVVEQGQEVHINVNPDVNLGTTKLWIDVLIRDGREVLGVVGTGLELDAFVRGVVDQGEPGITSLFVDHHGAIQAHRDLRYIDYASISKAPQERKTLDLVFDRAEDRDTMAAAMTQSRADGEQVITRFVRIGDKRYLAGIAHLSEINWFEITLLDLDVLLPLSGFSGLLVVYGLTLLAALLLFNLVLGRQILAPLARMDEAMNQVEQGQDLVTFPDLPSRGEVARLIEHFQRMTGRVRESRLDLERKVQERTEALERLVRVDPLTELLNRRGLSEHIEAEVSRGRREKIGFGLLWLDVDWFKEINDHHGHGIGDQALRAVASLVVGQIREYDHAARWGGDEFLILVPGGDAAALAVLGERIRAGVAGIRQVVSSAGPVNLAVSVGGYFSQPGDDMETALLRADEALYAAKAAGRNTVRIYAAGA